MKIKKITYFIIALVIALGLWLVGTTIIFGSGNTVETGATITKYDYSKTVGSNFKPSLTPSLRTIDPVAVFLIITST